MAQECPDLVADVSPEASNSVLRQRLMTYISDNESAFTKVSLFLCYAFFFSGLNGNTSLIFCDDWASLENRNTMLSSFWSNLQA